METISVRCNHCGAPLDVAPRTHFVTCQFCHSQLEVKRTDSAIFTEEVSRIAATTEKMASSLEVIQLQNEIERLDREWAAGQAPSAETAGKPAASQATGSAVFGLAFTVFFALVCFGMAGAMGSADAGLFALVPIGMGLFALVAGIMGVAKARSLADMADPRSAQDARRLYEERRRDLVNQLASQRGPES